MTAQRLHTAAVDTIAGGACTLTFDATPQGLVWTGTISVPASDLGATWTAYIGENLTSARPLGSWLGRAVFGPVQTYGRERLLIVGSGLTSTGQLQGVLLGQSEDEGSAVPASPLPFVSSLSLAQLVTGSLIVGPAGNQVRIVPNAPPAGQTEIEFDDGNPNAGYLRANPGLTPQSYLELVAPYAAGTSLPASLALSADTVASLLSIAADRITLTGQHSSLIGNVGVITEPATNVQWILKIGSTVNNFGATNPVAINFGTAFPNSMVAAITANGDASPRGAVFNAEARSVNGFSIYGTGTAGMSRVDWVAFGY